MLREVHGKNKKEKKHKKSFEYDPVVILWWTVYSSWNSSQKIYNSRCLPGKFESENIFILFLPS